jgi:hypothetical protein
MELSEVAPCAVRWTLEELKSFGSTSLSVDENRACASWRYGHVVPARVPAAAGAAEAGAAEAGAADVRAAGVGAAGVGAAGVGAAGVGAAGVGAP